MLELEPSTARGGQELSLYDVCSGLAERGHEIDLLYTHEGDLLERYRRFCRRIDRVHGYNIDRRRTLGALVEMAGDLVQCGRSTPDVIYLNQYFDTPFARLLGWRFRRPVVCHLRLAPPDRFSGQFRWGMRAVSRFIAISQYTRDEYIARGIPPGRIGVVYNGIDVREYAPLVARDEGRRRLGVDPRSYVIVYAGRLHHQKSIEVAIDAVAELAEPADLVIAGRPLADGSTQPYEAELRARARARGVAARCHFLGHVSPIAELYAAADVTVLPPVGREAFGRVVIESMACRTPAVASRSGGIPEILSGEFGDHLFAPGDSRDLARRLSALRDWRVRDPQLGERCRSHVEREFGVRRSVEGVERTLDRALGEWRSAALLDAPAWRIH